MKPEKKRRPGRSWEDKTVGILKKQGGRCTMDWSVTGLQDRVRWRVLISMVI